MQEGSYIKGSNDTVQLAARNCNVKCLGKGTIPINGILLQNCIQFNGLNESLSSLGQLCDENKTVVFTKKKDIIDNLTTFSVNQQISFQSRTEILKTGTMN